MTSPARIPRRRWLSAAGSLLLLTGLLPASAAPVFAAGSAPLDTIGVAYTQNFDTLANTGTGNTALPVGWALTEGGGGSRDNEQYAADNGGSATGDTYSYGTTGSTERAFGELRSGNLIPLFGASFTNSTGQTINSLEVAYTGEQWRLGAVAAGRLDRIDFQISTNATSLTTGTWADVNTLDFTAPVQGPTAGALDGNASANRTAVAATIASLAVAGGTSFWIRWTDVDATSNDDGLAVDDFSLTPHTTVSPTDPTGTGAATPSSVAPGGSSVLTVAVSPGTNPTSTGLAVIADLSAIGGSATQPFVDDATDGDAVAGDGVFSFLAVVVAGTSPGSKSLPATITDAQSRTGSASIALEVLQPPAAIKISEIYGGGGNAGATLKNDFIELYNPTADAVSLAGWSVQYASAAGSTWQVTSLTGSLPAGRNYLVQEAAGAGGSVNLPTPDATGSIPMAATAGKVALINTTIALAGSCPSGPAIVDFVGYGTTANCFEGSGPTPAPSNTTSAQRVGGGATDTDNNAADFVVATPDPHTAGDQAPTVASSTPANSAVGVARDATVTITFSEPVDVTGAWFSIACASSGAHGATASGDGTTFTLDPDVDFAANESCTLTIVAANVADQDTEDPPDTMAADATITFTTIDAAVCGDPGLTPIHDIQGAGLTSPIAGSVVSVEGVVVGDYQQAGGFGGFYVEEEDADADANPATSEGLFVFSTVTDVSVGDHVRAKGTVFEFVTSSGGVSSQLTELTSVSGVLVCSTGNVEPTAAHLALPVANLGDWEAVEGMRVELDQPLTVTEVFNLARFGEVSLSGAGRLPNPTNVVPPGAPSIAREDLNNRSRFILDDGDNQQNIDPTHYPQGGLSASNTLRVGDSLPGLTGVGDERFGSYRIQPVGPISFDHTNPRPAAPEDVGGNLRVASFNVLNFFNGNGTHLDGAAGGFPTERGATTLFEFNRQLAKEVSAITALDADVIGLMELENDDPAAGQAAIEDLVDGLNGATAPGTYAFINTGIVGTDAIRVGLIYKPAVVSPVGAFAKIDSNVDPRFIDTKNRPSIAQTFELIATGARLTVVVNHLKSKGSACDDVADPDTGDGQGNCNITRTEAAEAIVDWLATDPTGSGDADYLLIGDMNSYAMEDPITAFKSGGFVDTINAHIGAGAYSYVFDGESGYLDHALASASLAGQVDDVTEWHINPDEPTALDYNTEFKSAGQVGTFYDPSPYRSSDHDPVLVGLDLKAPNAAPTVDAGGPYEVSEGESVTVSASGSDPDGDALTYAWDLDNNGTFETSGQSATFSAAGLQAPETLTIRVRVSDGLLSATDTATVNVIWRFTGFFPPVDNQPTLNVANSGSTIPIKFALGGDQGLDIVADGYPASILFACDATAPTDAIESTSGPGRNGLSFDPGSSTYQYNWKTKKSWAGTCRRFVLKLADGTFHYADFSFVK